MDRQGVIIRRESGRNFLRLLQQKVAVRARTGREKKGEKIESTPGLSLWEKSTGVRDGLFFSLTVNPQWK